jgi:aminopeptidase C
LRDIVDYELIATMALLETAADRRENLLQQIYEINLSTIDQGKKGEFGFAPKERKYAALIRVSGQQDANEVAELIDKLMIAGVEVHRAKNEFKLEAEIYPAGNLRNSV